MTLRLRAYTTRSMGRERFLNQEVVAAMDACEPFDVCLLTNISDPQATYDDLVDQISMERVVVPEILGLTTNS